MKAYFLDVEQGDSTLVIFSDKTAVLVDCNFYEDADYEKIKRILSDNECNNSVIDALFITHPHEDHIRGIKSLGEQFDIKAVYESGHRLFISDDDKSKHYKDMIDLIAKVKRNGGSHEKLKAYDKFDLGSGVVQVFSPTKIYLDTQKPTERDIHGQCLVFKFEEFSRSIMFTGDSDMESWRDYIVPNYSDVKGKDNLLSSTVLSASHHGSNTFFYKTAASDGELYLVGLEKVNPDITIISAGVKNRHGHPDRKALELYKKHSLNECHVYQTKHSGAIIFEVSDDGDYRVYSDDFMSRLNFRDKGDSSVRIDSSPQPLGVGGSYKKSVKIKFTANYRNLPSGNYSTIKWTVQNNSKFPDKHHDFYEGQNSKSRVYENFTAYKGEHVLLCEVKDERGHNICTDHIVVKVV